MENRDIQLEIRSAFDSVYLIIRNEEDSETISRNVEHLKIKMNDIDFVNGLTEGDFDLISSLIKDK